MRFTKVVLAGIGGVITAGLGAPRMPTVRAMDRTSTAAARQAAQQLNLPTIQVYSRETVVDVTVTDAKGNPVHGLTRDDFTVKEDGKPQAIRSFEEFGSHAVSQPPKLPPNVHTNLQPSAPSSATNVLWLDFTNVAPILNLNCCHPIPPFHGTEGSVDLSLAMGRQRRAQQGAMKYLNSLPPGTRVAVFGTTYPPGNLRVLQGVTSDPELLSAAVNTLSYATDGMVDVEQMAMMGPPIVGGGGPTTQLWCIQQERRNRSTLEALNRMAADLEQIKGRKNLLWLTARIWTLTNPQRPPCLSDPTKELNKAYGLLAAAQVTVFPISIRGVEEVFNNIEQANDELTLESIAEATGGTAYYNSNDLGDLVSKAVSAGSDYYTLSYVPPGSEYDGRHHMIDVKAAKPGLHLTYRDSYYAEDPAKMKPAPGLTLAMPPPAAGQGSSPIDMRLAMGRSMPTSQQLLFDIQVEPSTAPSKPGDPPVLGALDPVVYAKLKGKPPSRYGFEYVLPARQISFTNTPEGDPKASLEFDLAVYDASGKLVTSLSQSIQPVITTDQYQQLMKGPFRFFQQLDLPPGQFFVRIGVLDRTSNKVGTLEIPLTVAKSTSLATNTK